jgi:hypothetical protein
MNFDMSLNYISFGSVSLCCVGTAKIPRTFIQD